MTTNSPADAAKLPAGPWTMNKEGGYFIYGRDGEHIAFVYVADSNHWIASPKEAAFAQAIVELPALLDLLAVQASQIEALTKGVSSIVNCQSPLTRAQMREAAADILDDAKLKCVRQEDQPPWIARATSAEAKAAKMREAVAEQISEGYGFWRACSGCQESSDGCVPAKDYPHSDIFQCPPGGGCSECGGIGVVWDDYDYDADALAALDQEAQP